MMKLEEVVSAYETYPEVEEKYNKIVEAESGRGNDAAGTTFDPPKGSQRVSSGQDNGTGRGTIDSDRELL